VLCATFGANVINIILLSCKTTWPRFLVCNASHFQPSWHVLK